MLKAKFVKSKGCKGVFSCACGERMKIEDYYKPRSGVIRVFATCACGNFISVSIPHFTIDDSVEMSVMQIDWRKEKW